MVQFGTHFEKKTEKSVMLVYLVSANSLYVGEELSATNNPDMSSPQYIFPTNSKETLRNYFIRISTVALRVMRNEEHLI